MADNMTTIKTGINETSIAKAKEDLKKMLEDEGVNGDPTINKMIESISSQLQNINMQNGNIIQTMLNIAKTATEDLHKDSNCGNAKNSDKDCN
jgi:hypothetical protein